MIPIRRFERILALSAAFALAVGCFVVLRPFLSPMLWSLILCFSTWPVYVRCLKACGGRRTVAALILTAVLALFAVLPFAMVGPRLAEEATIVATVITKMLEEGPPGPPAWIADLPLIGSGLSAYWTGLAENGGAATAQLKQYVWPWRNWLISAGVTLGQGVLQLCLSLMISFFIYRDGEALSQRLSVATTRFLGERARTLIDLTGATSRSVVYGVLGTALALGVLAAVAFAIAGIPGAMILGLATFFVSLIPMGPGLVWLPPAGWLMWQGEVGWGIFVLLYGLVVVSVVDGFLKPYFISRGGQLPFMLVFLGVLGGIAAFGFIGVFLGPVLLAIGFSLAKEWSLPREIEPPVAD